MSQTANRLPLATAAGIALLVANPCPQVNGDDSYYAVEVFANADGDAEYLEEMAAWGAASDLALLNCDEWE